MQRYFIKNEQKHGAYITITDKNDIHHIQNVMRMTPGDEIVCTDDSEQVHRCTITNIEDMKIRVSINDVYRSNTELPVEVTIFQGLPKKNKLEWIIQKGTELGCAKFELFQAERSIAKWDGKKTTQKLNRLERIAKEASEQCSRGKVPTIGVSNTLESILNNKDQYDILLFAYEEEAKVSNPMSIGNALKSCGPGMRIGIFIGPEGGFSEKEAILFRRYGVSSVRLGPRILRTETASLYALACISYYFEEMGCE